MFNGKAAPKLWSAERLPTRATPSVTAGETTAPTGTVGAVSIWLAAVAVRF